MMSIKYLNQNIFKQNLSTSYLLCAYDKNISESTNENGKYNIKNVMQIFKYILYHS